MRWAWGWKVIIASLLIWNLIYWNWEIVWIVQQVCRPFHAIKHRWLLWYGDNEEQHSMQLALRSPVEVTMARIPRICACLSYIKATLSGKDHFNVLELDAFPRSQHSWSRAIVIGRVVCSCFECTKPGTMWAVGNLLERKVDRSWWFTLWLCQQQNGQLGRQVCSFRNCSSNCQFAENFSRFLTAGGMSSCAIIHTRFYFAHSNMHRKA